MLFLNETWLDDSFLDSEQAIPGYNLIRQDRNRFGGGLAVYVDEELKFKRRDIFSLENVDIDSSVEVMALICILQRVRI